MIVEFKEQQTYSTNLIMRRIHNSNGNKHNVIYVYWRKYV